ncbi:cation diffusion facilitator family transporter [Rubrobacter xylanophilus DSM 9941]|uniref:Cation diffusion facilitator family transporter n=1 Tax=Rubrobacter xylanophilus (strain DSM 9941 / JCM 11954 / NBRC 16129 / PRD-1) TaxID=266117 RepID=Q1AYG1_RUBXD|nr:cation diffusion facilitator family transporter [Rubrobacter xylanophilus]ABG03567.1 cation diffusion facilitator family transporter [Rubrobacter xylanophilus DSM 9941]
MRDRDALEASEQGIRAVKLSFAVLALTAVLQLAVALVSGSAALLADTAHNFGDALTALPLWLAFALSRRPPSRTHTYGYGRAEDLAGAAIVGIILLSALVCGYESATKLLEGSGVRGAGWVALAAAAGFAGNELAARLRISVGRRIGSAALVADGQHARTDGLTSLAVLAGAAGAWLGYPVVDPLVGLGITAAILHIVRDSARPVWRRLMDAVEPGTVEALEEAASGMPEVLRVEEVRARWTGHSLQAEVRVRVEPDLPAGRLGDLSGRLAAAARKRLPRLERVLLEPVPDRPGDV